MATIRGANIPENRPLRPALTLFYTAFDLAILMA